MTSGTVARFIIVARVSVLALLAIANAPTCADPPIPCGNLGRPGCLFGGPPVGEPALCDGGFGAWYWVRSPEQEARRAASLYNHYCIRCHGCDGRGVWDIPDVPDFTCVRWQASRSDAQLTRLTLEGRGAVMPAFRGTLSLEEAAALARYLRRFAPPSEYHTVEEAPQPYGLP
jgi:cytochrome c553